MLDLSTREFEDMVTIFDVCKAIQRCEMSRRIASEIEPYILELGTEGRLIELQLRELTIPIEEASLVTRITTNRNLQRARRWSAGSRNCRRTN